MTVEMWERDLKDPRETKDLWDTKDQVVTQVCQDTLDVKVFQGRMARREQRGIVEMLEHKAMQDIPVGKDFPAPLNAFNLVADIQVRMVNKALQVRVDQLVLLVQRVQLDHRGLRDLKGMLDLLDLKVLLDQEVSTLCMVVHNC